MRDDYVERLEKALLKSWHDTLAEYDYYGGFSRDSFFCQVCDGRDRHGGACVIPHLERMWYAKNVDV